MVLAGAGSGKTRVLTYRTYWLIKERGVDARKIVLLAFTNKAAREMSGRVKELLKEQGLTIKEVSVHDHEWIQEKLKKQKEA